MEERPLVVAALIVRDEEAVLDECLASLAGVVDRIEVVDTGSTDRTLDIAMAHGANLSRIGWRDDFAWARNHALDAARDARFVLFIDADERLVVPDPQKLRRTLDATESEVCAFEVEIRSLDRARLIATHRARRLATSAGTHWVGAVNEQLEITAEGQDVEMEADVLAIDHIGAAADIRESKDKAARNLRIARSRLKGHAAPETVFEYLRSLSTAGQPADQVEAEFVELFADPGWFHPRQASTLHGYRSVILAQLGRYEDAIGEARLATALVPANHQAASTEASLLYRRNSITEVVRRFHELWRQPSMRPLYEELAARESWLRTVLRSCLDIGDEITALRVVVDPSFPAETNPWPRLIESSAVANESVAATAGRVADARFLAAVAAADKAPDRTVLAGWIQAGGDPETVAAFFPSKPGLSLPPEPGLIAAAAALDRESATTLAKRAAHGHLDLELELDSLPPGAPIEAALEIAMVGLDRIPHTGALRLAEVLDHRRPRVAAILARDLLASGEGARAADLIDRVDMGVAGPLTTSTLVDLGVLGNLRGRGFGPAAQLATEVAVQGVAISVWSELVSGAGTDLERIMALVNVAALGDPAPLLDIVEELHPAHQLEYCAGLLVAGSEHPRAVALGLIAAGAAQIDEAGETLARWAPLLDRELIDLLIESLAPLMPRTVAALQARGT